MNAVNWPVYLGLSAMFSLEFAVWGAWMPVLAARLLGPLKMSGKQTGWIYAAMPLASLVAFPLGGYLADKYVDAKWIMVARARRRGGPPVPRRENGEVRQPVLRHARLLAVLRGHVAAGQRRRL